MSRKAAAAAESSSSDSDSGVDDDNQRVSCDDCGKKVSADTLITNVHPLENGLCEECVEDLSFCCGGCDVIFRNEKKLKFQCALCDGRICGSKDCGFIPLDAVNTETVICCKTCPMIHDNHACATCREVFVQELEKDKYGEFHCISCSRDVGSKRRSVNAVDRDHVKRMRAAGRPVDAVDEQAHLLKGKRPAAAATAASEAAADAEAALAEAKATAAALLVEAKAEAAAAAAVVANKPCGVCTSKSSVRERLDSDHKGMITISPQAFRDAIYCSAMHTTKDPKYQCQVSEGARVGLAHEIVFEPRLFDNTGFIVDGMKHTEAAEAACLAVQEKRRGGAKWPVDDPRLKQAFQAGIVIGIQLYAELHPKPMWRCACGGADLCYIMNNDPFVYACSRYGSDVVTETFKLIDHAKSIGRSAPDQIDAVATAWYKEKFDNIQRNAECYRKMAASEWNHKVATEDGVGSKFMPAAAAAAAASK